MFFYNEKSRRKVRVIIFRVPNIADKLENIGYEIDQPCKTFSGFIK